MGLGIPRRYFHGSCLNCRQAPHVRSDKFVGPIVNAHTNLTEIDQTMDLLWRNKVCDNF